MWERRWIRCLLARMTYSNYLGVPARLVISAYCHVSAKNTRELACFNENDHSNRGMLVFVIVINLHTKRY